MVMDRIPKYSDEELNVIADGIRETLSKIEGNRRHGESLGETLKTLIDDLERRTYEWRLNYEFRVKYNLSPNDSTFPWEKWFPSNSVSNSPYYSSRFMETEQECREAVTKAKEKIKDRVGENVKVYVSSLISTRKDGIITDFNIPVAIITIGPEFKYGYVVLKERKAEMYEPLVGS